MTNRLTPELVTVYKDWLSQCFVKLRLATHAAENGEVDLHSLYKAQQFLRESLPKNLIKEVAGD